MIKIALYRTLVIGGFFGAVLFMTGCDGDAMKKHATLKEEQYQKWNLTRVAVMYQLAEQQYQVGDYDKCRETLTQALALKAPFPKLPTLAAKVEIEQGSLELAANYLHQAIQLAPGDPEPYYMLGVIYQRWQKPEVATDYYQQAWDRNTDNALYMLAVVEMKITLGKLDAAEKILEDKLVYFEQSAAVRVALARIATLKNDYASACKLYRDAVILAPDDKSVQRSYGESLFYAEHYSDAIPVLEELRKQTEIADKGDVLMMLGQAYLSVRRPFDARNCFQEVLRDNSNDKQAYLALAKACIGTNENGLALSAARKVLRMDPDDVQAMILLAVMQQKQKHWQEAEETLAKASHLAPKDSTVLCMMGVSSQELGNKADALEDFEKAVQANPKDNWATDLLDRAKPVEANPAKGDSDGSPTSAGPAVGAEQTAAAATQPAVGSTASISSSGDAP